MSIKILDCSLREGGYINDWDFGHNNLVNVYERIAQSHVDMIEVGFIDDRRPYDINRSIFPDTESIGKIYGTAKGKPNLVFGMIDYGTCDISRIQDCKDSFIDGIRVIFKKHLMVEAMDYCHKLIDKGYKVCAQLVAISSYTDEDLNQIISIANSINPYAISIVDTYGLLHPTDVIHYYDILDTGLNENISLGCHTHNNLQLAYANSITFIDKARNGKREYIVDGTLFGMGKSAGNTPIELLCKYINSIDGNYRVEPLLEGIEESVKDIYNKSPWGYKTVFYLASENRCHPLYVNHYQKKENLSVSKIDEILSVVGDSEYALSFNREYAEMLYNKYIDEKLDDKNTSMQLATEIQGRKVLIVGPGKNLRLQHDRVKTYIDKEKPYVISLNYIPEITDINAVFVTKINRLTQMKDRLSDNKVSIIATSNIDVVEDTVYTFNRECLLEPEEDIKDNTLIMLLKILKSMNVKSIALAGLDGYSDKEDNYIDPNMEDGYARRIARNLNRRVRYMLENEYKNISVEFVTFSHYMETEDIDSGGY